MQMPKKLPRNYSYLLRVWEEDGVVRRWRFMLENPHSGEKRGFGSCEELTAFIETKLAREPETTQAKEHTS